MKQELRTHIVIHHSATEDSGTVSWGAIQDYHVKTNGWKDIGYHYGVERIDGRLYALIGRPEDQAAAACKEEGMNRIGLHICVVGDYDKHSPDLELLDFLAERVIVPLMRRYQIGTKNIVGHREFAPYKTCPGEKFMLDGLRKRCGRIYQETMY